MERVTKQREQKLLQAAQVLTSSTATFGSSQRTVCS